MAEINPEHGASEVLHGQSIDLGTGVPIPFTEQTVPYTGDGERVTGLEGTDNAEIQPVNRTEAKIRIQDPDGTLGPILDDLLVSNAATIASISFPPTLTDVIVTFNSNVGAGEDSHPASQQSFEIFGGGTGSLSPTSSAQGSASIIPDVQPIIVERFHENVDAMEYTLYMEDGATAQDVRDHLSALLGQTVNAWPQFHPVGLTITANGQSASVSAKADTRVFIGGTTESGQAGYEWGNASSKETGTTVKTLTISATIHGTIVLDTPTASETAEAEADASTDTFAAGSLAPQPPIVNTKSVSADVNASVSVEGGTTISATSPAAIPTTGLYARSITPGARAFGIRTIYQVIVVDFATLTP